MASKTALRPLCASRVLYTLPASIRQCILRPQHVTSNLTLRHASQIAQSQIVRPLVPPPDEGSGPLLSRRSDRELPSIAKSRTWLKTLPVFVFLITVTSLAMFNYQKSTSSTVNAILYALRTNEHARALLGDEIYFASKVPWIWGDLTPLQGVIDISFWVKGTKGQALTKFVSVRKRKDGFFETLEWSLKTEDGRQIQLLETDGTRDPLQTGR